MPIHHRIVPVIGQAIISRGLYNWNRYTKYDNKLWKSAWPDKAQRLGVRHGVAVGSTIGSFLYEGSIFSGNGSSYVSPSNSFFKARSGRSKFNNSRYRRKSKCNCKRRQSGSRFSKRGRKRFYR